MPTETPTFAATDRFARGVVGSMNVVEKEMFSSATRTIPHAVAGGTGAVVCRDMEHGMQELLEPVRLCHLVEALRRDTL